MAHGFLPLVAYTSFIQYYLKKILDIAEVYEEEHDL